MTDWTDLDIATLRRQSPEGIVSSLQIIEAEIVNTLGKEMPASDIRVGIPVLDWLVDQVRFVREIRIRSPRDMQYLWLLEMLSLPECLRLARTKWQKEHLVREALILDNLRWKEVLLSRRRKNSLEMCPRAQLDFYPRQLSPYGSHVGLPKRRYLPWGFRADLSLRFNSMLTEIESLLKPVQSLENGSGLSFSIQINLGDGVFLLDPPRDCLGEQCLQQLRAWSKVLDAHIAQPDAPPSVASGAVQFVSLLGWGRSLIGPVVDSESTKEGWTRMRKQLREDIERLQQPKLSRSQRARITQKYFEVPGTFFLGPVRILPLDCPIALLPLILGPWMSEQDLLTIRDKRKLNKYVLRQLLMIDSETSLDKVQDLIPETIKGLAQFDRPLRGASVQSYLRLLMMRARQSGIQKTAVRVPKGSLSDLAKTLKCSPRTVRRMYLRYCKANKLGPKRDTCQRFRKSCLQRQSRSVKRSFKSQ